MSGADDHQDQQRAHKNKRSKQVRKEAFISSLKLHATCPLQTCQAKSAKTVRILPGPHYGGQWREVQRLEGGEMIFGHSTGAGWAPGRLIFWVLFSCLFCTSADDMKDCMVDRPALQSQLSTSALQAASAAKSSLRSPASFDGTPRSALKPTAQGDASALLNLTSKRPVMAISTNHTVISGDDLDVGDTVDVPGGMHGTIKFIGEVRGKKGIFAGVELSREWAARGKNDGDVDGTRYFTTSIPGSGIFLPSNKAFKRASPTDSSDSFPPTPTTPSLAPFNPPSQAPPNTQTPPTPLPSRFAQSLGPGRAASPAFRPKSRPSLPRPESPLRKTQNSTSTPVGRPSIGTPKLSKSIIGTPRHAPSPTPGKFGGSFRGMPGDPGKRPTLASG
ncbi:MAG: hypothetical protein Q9193_002535 [Seirophora villosa]